MTSAAILENADSGFENAKLWEDEKKIHSTVLEYRRDYGFGFGGFLLGVLLIMLIFWYRGGFTPGSGPLSIFDFRTRQNTETLDSPTGTVNSTATSTVGAAEDYSLSGDYPPPDRNGRLSSGELRVRVSNLSLRRCPGDECARLSALPLGTGVTLTGQRQYVHDQEWVRVRAGGQDGWVNRYYLE